MSGVLNLFILRHARNAKNAQIAELMNEVRVQGLHRIQVRDEKGDPSEAILEIKYRRIRVLRLSASTSNIQNSFLPSSMLKNGVRHTDGRGSTGS